MKKILAIAKWEYIEKVRTKTFIISMFLTPAIIIFFTLAPTLFSSTETRSTAAFGIIDTSGYYFNFLREKLEAYQLPNGQPKYILINFNSENKPLNEIKERVDKELTQNSIEGCLVIYNGGTDSVSAEMRTSSSAGFAELNDFESEFNDARAALLLQKMDSDPDLIDAVTKNVKVHSIRVDQTGKESQTDFLTLFYTSFILIMLLMMMILSSGGMLVRSLLEEKSNRLIEILVSSCTKRQLLAGKIIALSGIGFTQLAIWAIFSLSLSSADILPPEAFNNIIPMLLYFVLGYIFYTSVFVGVGSIVTTEQEAQQYTSYISLILLLPTVFSLAAIQNPGSTLIKILSYIPFTSTSIMLLRLKLENVNVAEMALTILIMLFSIYAMVLFSSKLFKVGILSYGKKPTFKEIIRWITEK